MVKARVLVDAHMLGEKETGNEAYILNLLKHLPPELLRGGAISAYTAAPGNVVGLPEGLVCYCDPQAAGDVYRFLQGLPRAVASASAGLLHVTYHAPFWIRVPYVVTIHDVSYRLRPRLLSARNLVLQNLLGWLTAKRAAAAITVSDYSRREIERIYPWLRGRVHVTYDAAADGYRPQPMDEIEAVKRRFGLKERYLLFVGGLRRRKNILALGQAFVQVLSRHPGLQLVMVGSDTTSGAKDFRAAFAGHIRAGDIALLGYVEDVRQIACLYSGCQAFVFPSLYEGFGIPVVEAMRCGAAVVASNTTALPEVAGGAALLVNPESQAELAEAMAAVVERAELRQDLIARGFKRAEDFSWAKTARQTAGIYSEVAGVYSGRQKM